MVNARGGLYFLSPEHAAFEPRAVVCWLAGAPAEALPRDVPSAYAVMQHRLQLQHAVVRLASRLGPIAPTIETRQPMTIPSNDACQSSAESNQDAPA